MSESAQRATRAGLSEERARSEAKRGKLNLDPQVVAEARRSAAPAAEPVIGMAPHPYDRVGGAGHSAAGRPVRCRPGQLLGR